MSSGTFQADIGSIADRSPLRTRSAAVHAGCGRNRGSVRMSDVDRGIDQLVATHTCFRVEPSGRVALFSDSSPPSLLSVSSFTPQTQTISRNQGSTEVLIARRGRFDESDLIATPSTMASGPLLLAACDQGSDSAFHQGEQRFASVITSGTHPSPCRSRCICLLIPPSAIPVPEFYP
jgi:hypothetical protein